MAAEPGLGAAQRAMIVAAGWPAAGFRVNGTETALDAETLCRGCGACCHYSATWPRFSIEDEAALAFIPENFINERQSGMRCDGDRCSALSGNVGVGVRCEIYAVRPE